MSISYTISEVDVIFDIEDHVMYIGFDDIGHDIARSQWHLLRHRSSVCPGLVTPAPKSLSGTCPGFLHPLFCAIPLAQLDPLKFDEERSFHSATSTC